MNRFLFPLLLILSLLGKSYGEISNYIVGGVDAAPGEFPHEVSIRYYDQFLCAGSILDKRNILTAASCAIEILDQQEYFKVHAGTNLLSASGMSYGILTVTIHESFHAEPYERRNDIAILTVDEDIEFTEIIQPVELDNSTEIYDEERATLSGWGSKGSGGRYNDRLQVAEVVMTPQGKCKLVFMNLKEYQICAYNPGTGICEADSGSSLILFEKQIGIASFNRGCATGIPDVYTRVSSFVDWIERNKSNNGQVIFLSKTLLILSLCSLLL